MKDRKTISKTLASPEGKELDRLNVGDDYNRLYYVRDKEFHRSRKHGYVVLHLERKALRDATN